MPPIARPHPHMSFFPLAKPQMSVRLRHCSRRNYNWRKPPLIETNTSMNFKTWFVYHPIFSPSSVSSPLTEVDRRKMWQLRTSRMLVRTLMTFVITFALCWAPNQSMFLLYNIGVSINFASPVYHIGIILAVCNSCVNPILYTMTNKPFREGIRKAFRVGTARVGNTGPEQGSSTNNTATTRFGETTENL